MSQNPQTRRQFLKTSTAATTAAAAVAGTTPFWFSVEDAGAFNFKSSNERPVVGSIGTGSRWGAVGRNAMKFGDCIAVCDVDAGHARQAKKVVTDAQSKKGKQRDVAVHEDYRKILDDDSIDVVTIVTPDHWHTKIAIEAMQAGKDVYCEKPLTLTIEEGKQIIQVLDKTKRVFQVGTQQRSEMGQRFLQAVALLRDNRIGKVQKVTCAIGGTTPSGPIPKVDVPEGLNWEMWLGQTPVVDYRHSTNGPNRTRCHYEFRWWYEYSGGKMTDWGAHHVDIGQWGIDQLGDGQGPTRIVPKSAEHPTPLKDGMPTQDDRYNTAVKFHVVAHFPGGVEMHIRDRADDLGFDNGIMFEGTDGRFLVNRGKIVGAPVEELKKNPLPEDLITQIYKGKKPGDHMRNFFECLVTRDQPISDVHSHHRAMTTCHLANIAIRLDRELDWDPQSEQITNDKQANSFQSREQRKGYEINV